ncbi:16S rRNA (guanine(966)-N(2))-methyltransferase RsmD [Algimonas porphyrae]|uniref:Methyltransferase n=1 Tax=Algimonas porphyrae TaxID=1128113 RepID=A0ABQ5V5I9_9PROT|nr:16S rRNA (guanine(966)-N(2))-methyltransferase RsmD [Algimonas porphyrae]GLQ21935.1 methyltransferase [Algimonas porphyrae]
MRIVSGSHRGRTIVTPDGRNTRPTSDQTRESIFNILDHADWAPPLDGAHVLDIFAGSGALGLEAISRGAAFTVFVERHPQALAAIRKNINHFGLGDEARIHRFDATKLKLAPANRPASFTHVFMDPPYGKGLWSPVLRRLPQYLSADGIIILEESRDTEVAPTVERAGWEIMADNLWGAARVLFLKQK